ncbi:MAG TPA: hemolysin family protein [Terriglobia bacterium]|nr:hemolysin family protein [Terriglobia bacterium]
MLNGFEILISLIFVLVLFLMSIIEVAFGNVSKISVRRLLDNPKHNFVTQLAAMVDSRNEVLMSLQISIHLLLVVGAVFFFSVFERRAVPYLEGMPGTILLMFALILVFRHLLPRLLAAGNPELVLLYLFPIFSFSQIIMRPFSLLLSSVLNYFHRWEEDMEPAKEEETSEEEIQAFIDAGQEEGILEHNEGEMIQSIVQFGDKVAREVMTPRTQIIAIDINSPVEKLVQLITSRRHARIPVFRDDIDNVEGIIHERDLLRLWLRGEKLESLRSLVIPVHFVPETKPVDDLLDEMKTQGEQIVLVVDEYGGISGLITMEDLVEEILGEMHDSDSDGEKIIEETPGVYIVPGSLELGSLNSTLGTPFVEETECTTVAGAVVELFGRLPSAGEKIDHRGISVEVLDADRRRVYRLRMRILAPKIEEAPKSNPQNA